MEQDKVNAYMTLYTCLVTIAKAAAPMIPFMTEEIYLNLVCSTDPSAPESIHLCDYPQVNEAHIDKALEAKMAEVSKIVTTGRAARNAANIKNRQPLAMMYVKAPNTLDTFYTDIIEEPLIAGRFLVYSGPTVLLLLDGKEVYRASGFIDVDDLDRKIIQLEEVCE